MTFSGFDQRLLVRITRAWSAETSVDNQWSPDNPALGQCAVTALVVQDHFGGDLLRVVNESVSHYFNFLPNGDWVDLTRSQFDTWAPRPPELRTRDYVLSFQPTKDRYDILRSRLSEGVARREYTEADERADLAFLVGVSYGRESERIEMLDEGYTLSKEG